jgi:glutathione S-transferase
MGILHVGPEANLDTGSWFVDEFTLWDLMLFVLNPWWIRHQIPVLDHLRLSLRDLKNWVADLTYNR